MNSPEPLCYYSKQHLLKNTDIFLWVCAVNNLKQVVLTTSQLSWTQSFPQRVFVTFKNSGLQSKDLVLTYRMVPRGLMVAANDIAQTFWSQALRHETFIASPCSDFSQLMTLLVAWVQQNPVVHSLGWQVEPIHSLWALL